MVDRPTVRADDATELGPDAAGPGVDEAVEMLEWPDAERATTPEAIRDEILELVASALLARIADPVLRWHTATQLRDALSDRLLWVQALSAAQLTAEGKSVDQAAKELGITRQHVSRVMANHDQPTPRKRAAEQERTPAFRWGEYLAEVDALARAVAFAGIDEGLGAEHEMDKLMERGYTSMACRAAVERAIHRWLHQLARSGRQHVHDQYATRIAKAASDLEDLRPAHFTLKQQEQMILGYHTRSLANRASTGGRDKTQ